MSNKLFRWTFTAIVTPLKDNSNVIDWDVFKNLVEKQIEWWVNWIVFVWTTWESPTLTHDEHVEILKWSVKAVNWRCLCIHWTWSNSTREAEYLSKAAEQAWADWLLIVSPYYNKPTQEGLFRHFSRIADEVVTPIILYNIKWRTWVNIETPTLVRLAGHKNIVWVKEASWDIEQMMDVINQTPDDFCVLSGDDSIVMPFISLWWDWIISVASNYIPRIMCDYVNFSLNWDFDKARGLHYKLLDVFRAWFIETNPIPAKEILGLMWLISPNLRMPLCNASSENLEKLKKVVEFIKNESLS